MTPLASSGKQTLVTNSALIYKLKLYFVYATTRKTLGSHYTADVF